jgi:toxin-antitoxin system PIN domain toxin
MIAVDSNLLVYAHREDAEWHAEASAVMLRLANGNEPWAIPWPCVHEFLAIVTHPNIYKPPTPLKIACKAIRAWTAAPTLVFIGEGLGYFDKLEELALGAKAVGGAIHDARIAAICRHHGVKELWSADRDFARFRDFKARNPLVLRPPAEG